MRLSRYFLPILRETPKEAEIVSHRLMLRAGLIRQLRDRDLAFLGVQEDIADNDVLHAGKHLTRLDRFAAAFFDRHAHRADGAEVGTAADAHS